MLTSVGLFLLFAFIAGGLPIAFALFTAGWLLVYLGTGDFSAANQLLVLTVEQSLRNYYLAVIPLFIIMGEVFARSGLVDDLFYFLIHRLKALRSGSLISVVIGNAIFAAATGVSIVSASLFGRVATPTLVKQGVREDFATGLIAGSSLLGMLIPPSILMIIYGLITDVSIGKLFLAGIVPGLLLAFAFIVYILVMGSRPFVRGFKTDAQQADLPVRAFEVKDLKGILSLLATIVAVLGGLYAGVVTVVEAAALGAAMAIVSAQAASRLRVEMIVNAFKSAVVVTSSIGMLFLGATFYSKALAYAGLQVTIQEFISRAQLEPWVLVILVSALVFVLGFFMDTVSTLTITIPIALPALNALGIDLIWFGVLVVLAAEMGLITPPVGLSVLALKASLPPDLNIPLGRIYRGSLPFLFLSLSVYCFILFFPWLILR